MNNLEQYWNRLISAARMAVADHVVPAPGWVTRIGALGLAEVQRTRAVSAWLAWAMPGFGVALLIAILAVVASRPVITQPESNSGLVALTDPLAGNSFLP
jgi:hypothetical protein